MSTQHAETKGGFKLDAKNKKVSFKKLVKVEKPYPADKVIDSKTTVTQVRAIWDFTARNSSELSFKKGDTIIVSIQSEGGWWAGQLGEKEGKIPTNYLEVIEVLESQKPAIKINQKIVSARIRALQRLVSRENLLSDSTTADPPKPVDVPDNQPSESAAQLKNEETTPKNQPATPSSSTESSPALPPHSKNLVERSPVGARRRKEISTQLSCPQRDQNDHVTFAQKPVSKHELARQRRQRIIEEENKKLNDSQQSSKDSSSESSDSSSKSESRSESASRSDSSSGSSSRSGSASGSEKSARESSSRSHSSESRSQTSNDNSESARSRSRSRSASERSHSHSAASESHSGSGSASRSETERSSSTGSKSPERSNSGSSRSASNSSSSNESSTDTSTDD